MAPYQSSAQTPTPRENSTLVFPSDSALFAKNTGGGAFGASHQISPSPLPSMSCARLNVGTLMNRGSGLRIGKILGIPIYLHSTWVFIFAAITYVIPSQFKPQHPLWTNTQHWTVGALTTLPFFPPSPFPHPSHTALP